MSLQVFIPSSSTSPANPSSHQAKVGYNLATSLVHCRVTNKLREENQSIYIEKTFTHWENLQKLYRKSDSYHQGLDLESSSCKAREPTTLSLCGSVSNIVSIWKTSKSIPWSFNLDLCFWRCTKYHSMCTATWNARSALIYHLTMSEVISLTPDKVSNSLASSVEVGFILVGLDGIMSICGVWQTKVN